MANDPQTALNLQINYFIISKLWDYENLKKNSNSRESKEVFYDAIGIVRNAYSRILSQDMFRPVDLNKKWNSQNKKLQSLGLSQAIMTGKEQIVLGDITREEWKEYFETRYHINDKKKDDRAYEMAEFDARLKREFEQLRVDRRAYKPIDRLFYYIHTGEAIDDKATDLEIKELLDILQRVKEIHWIDCDIALRKKTIEEINRQLQVANIVHAYQNIEKRAK